MNQEDWELKYTPTRKRQEKHIKPHKTNDTEDFTRRLKVRLLNVEADCVPNPCIGRFHKKIESLGSA
ncbi:hypothetical protein [Vulcanisaeta thermophila]|uniref:hypothetical protein n=1 Tax=Vulcanisaeta thermophila TaxID=867917 RepID=UPI0011803E69|nr:hypothetical protein [Vulcanisaeta thermophila]